ncbi:MAG TPA: diacylglycerol kinase family protein [Paludibacter sp.]|nr:diacylglycerol kinase family protein [Paludibacter sp.]HOS46838.1 diacylglycerol kinase family protein [Paludibacter sp.]
MKRLIQSFRNAFRGVATVFRTERNMRIHLTFTVLVIIFGWILRISITEWLLCLLCFGLVFTAEMVNTAIENVVDLVSPQQNKLAGKAKDIAAGAVLVSAIISACVGLIIFIPKLWAFILSLFVS